MRYRGWDRTDDKYMCVVFWLPDKTSNRAVCVCVAGDLIEQLQQFVAMIGWSQDMVDLITRREGYFKIVSIISKCFAFSVSLPACFFDSHEKYESK